jgi:predicted RNase H-like HicB family nuclease
MPRKSAMKALEGLERDVAALSPEDLAEFREWFHEHDWRAWDRKLETDVAAGKLDQLAEEAVHAHHAGRRQSMKQTYTAVIKQQGDWWIGWIEEVPGVNCQERSREELLESLRATLAEAIEFNRDEARGAAGSGYEELPIAV